MRLWDKILAIASTGPYAAPIWIACAFILLSFLRGPLIGQLFKAFRVKDAALADTMKGKIDRPLQMLFFVLAITPFTLLIPAPTGPILVVIVNLLAFALLFHIVIQSIDLAVFNWYLHRRQAKVASVVRVFILSILYAICAMLLLDWAVGVSILPILATSTVLTAVLGLAMQDTLKNAFAGLNMSLENSFEQGDWVMFRLDSATDHLYGQIVEIGWRTTKIKTLNNNYAIIPNSKFTTHELINFDKPTPVHARTVTIPVSLSADGENVKTALIRSAAGATGVLEDPPPDATPLEIKLDHVVYQLRFWIASGAEREHMTGSVLQRCWQELKELGALPKPPQ